MYCICFIQERGLLLRIQGEGQTLGLSALISPCGMLGTSLEHAYSEVNPIIVIGADSQESVARTAAARTAALGATTLTL